MALCKGLVLASVLLGILLSLLQGSTADVLDEIGCETCPEGIVCPGPSRRTCEMVRRPCGCCDECAGRKRQRCNAYTVPCESRFICVNNKGFGMKVIPFTSKFEGLCMKRARKGLMPVPLKLPFRFIYKGGR